MSEPLHIAPDSPEADAARTRHGAALVDRLFAAREEGDDVADRVAAEFAAMRGGAGWRALDRALAGGPRRGALAGGRRGGARAGGPRRGALDELLAPLDDPPAWLDPHLADAGAVAFWRVGSPMLFVTLTYGSLAFGYRSAELVRPLAATGRLEHMAPRRLGETTRWVFAVTEPGGMRVGGERYADGVAACVRVRLVHALVRAHLREAGFWQPEWGVPIHAAGALATAIGGFFVVPVRAMADLGVRFSPAV